MSQDTRKKRIGYYCWGGESTIKMLRTKYFNPKIDTLSVLTSYDYKPIKKLKDTFGITDFWATLYWGFGKDVEKKAEEFLLSKKDNFAKLGIKLHAYIQGTNLVTDNFRDMDLWARNTQGDKIPYFLGRSVTCVNNPNFRQMHRERVVRATKMDFEGIYIDNIQMGQMTIEINGKPLTFCGCNCIYCQRLFLDKYNERLPTNFEECSSETLENFLFFRRESITSWIKEIRSIIGERQLGTNFYDPSLDSNIVYGFDDISLAKIQDYVMYEHFAFPTYSRNLVPTVKRDILEIEKPIFSLPYKAPIGYDSSYSQGDYNRLFNVYSNTQLNLCIKGSEFNTKSVWHNLNIYEYRKPTRNDSLEIAIAYQEPKVFNSKLLSRIPFNIRDFLYRTTLELLMSNKRFRPIMRYVYNYVIR